MRAIDFSPVLIQKDDMLGYSRPLRRALSYPSHHIKKFSTGFSTESIDRSIESRLLIKGQLTEEG